MGSCSSKLSESDVKWLTMDNGATGSKRSGGTATAMEMKAAKSRPGSRTSFVHKQAKRSASGDKSLHARSKKASAEREGRAVSDSTGNRDSAPYVSADTSSRDISTKIISPTPRTPIPIQELSTSLENGQAGAGSENVEAHGVKLDFSTTVSSEPSRVAESVGNDSESVDDREPGNAEHSGVEEFNSKNSAAFENGQFMATATGVAGGNPEGEVDGSDEDDDDAATLMSVARGVDSHEHDRQSDSQEAEWSSLHNHPLREFNPIHFDHPSINGSLGDLPPPRGDITIAYQSNVANSNMTPPPPPTAALHYPGIGKSPFRKRINLFEMWNDAQPNSTSTTPSMHMLDRQPLPLATKKKRDSHESDRISQYKFKQRYEHALTKGGSSPAKYALQKPPTNKNDFDKENESSPANVTAHTNHIALSVLSTLPRSKVDPLRADCTPPRRPCNPHCGQIEKFGAYPLALTARTHNARSNDDCSWISKLQDHHSTTSN